MPAAMTATEKEAVKNIARWRLDPLAWVTEVAKDTPDEWQKDTLEYLGDCCKKGWNGKRLQSAVRVALKACKGPGKSRLIAWVVWWFLSTRPHANVVALSITGDNLQQNVWKELALLHGRTQLLQQAFEVNSELIYEKSEKGNKATWWCAARSFPQDADPQKMKSTIAGLHGAHVMVVLDEGGDMPVGLLVAAEGIFANLDEAILLMAGNPTSENGALYDACVRRAHRFKVITITGDPDDPKRSPRINVEEARQAIEDYGRDNPWVMANYLGLFPPVAADKLLGQADIDKARARAPKRPEFEQEPLIFGFDIARHGSDASELYARQGVLARHVRTWRTDDLMLLADQIAAFIIKEKPDKVFVGVTGMGWGCYDRLKKLVGTEILVPIDEASLPLEKQYLNRRAEMWFNCAQWVKRHGAIPTGDPELHADLMAPSYEYRASGRQTKLVLEPNDQIKAALGRSPDKGTALALTFAAPVAPRGMAQAHSQMRTARTDFDPYAHMGGR